MREHGRVVRHFTHAGIWREKGYWGASVENDSIVISAFGFNSRREASHWQEQEIKSHLKQNRRCHTFSGKRGRVEA
jgi:hypothetical protein